MKLRYGFILLLLPLIFCSCKSEAKNMASDSAELKKVDPAMEKVESVWLEDYDEAMALAKKENKKVLINFSGSDWCGWCIKLDDEVFSRRGFAEFAKDNLVLLKLDFPRKTMVPPEIMAEREKYLKKYGVQGFPTILITDSEGNVTQKTGYRQGGPKKYVDHLKI